MDTTNAVFETPLASDHRAAGAQLAEFNGCLLPETFSDFESEYRAAKETVALLDTNWHTVVTLSGRDRVKYLHAVTSNDIKGLGEDFGTRALLLNPQGHILAELEIYALEEKLLVLSYVSARERTTSKDGATPSPTSASAMRRCACAAVSRCPATWMSCRPRSTS